MELTKTYNEIKHFFLFGNFISNISFFLATNRENTNWPLKTNTLSTRKKRPFRKQKQREMNINEH